jgi:glycosyltransferase involved in cell wall biosynthesis
MDRSEDDTTNTPLLSMVIPVYEEQENLPELYRRLNVVAGELLCDVEFVFINDGSRDKTGVILDELARTDTRLQVYTLSRNFGHQAAVTAGLEAARGQVVVVLDGDLQDPPEIIPQLMERWREGYDVVYAVRTKRKESWFKRAGYFVFYRVLKQISDTPMPLDTGDFCLMDRRVVNTMNAMPERTRFVRGLRAYAGFRQVGVTYEREARYAGVPKYTFRRLVALALEGVLNFSTVPLQVVGWLTALLIVVATVMAITQAVMTLAGVSVAPVWIIATLLVFLGALQIGAVAVVGAYVAKIFAEVKQRPTYIFDGEAQPSRTTQRVMSSV